MKIEECIERLKKEKWGYRRYAYSGICKICNNVFYRIFVNFKRETGTFCSIKCRGNYFRNGEYVKCKNCNKSIYKSANKIASSLNCYCSHKCQFEHARGSQSPIFKGWKQVKSGYLKCSIDGKSTFMHRYIMEKHLGRKLNPKTEKIHHINHDKTDNRIENLQILSHSEHAKLHAIERHKICPQFGRNIKTQFHDSLEL